MTSMEPAITAIPMFLTGATADRGNFSTEAHAIPLQSPGHETRTTAFEPTTGSTMVA